MDAPRVPHRVTAWLAPVTVLLFALAVRAPFYWGTFLPLNDGGMFAQMIDNLRGNGFALPFGTTYNFEQIPFCYPPIGFYVGAMVQFVTGATSMQVLRWLPLVFNLGTVLALYFVALELFRDRATAFCAGVIYAALPRSAEWLTMGGGLTRSPAEMFVLVSVWCFLRARNSGRRFWGALAGVSAGAAVLTHLEAGVLVAVSLVVLALFTRPWSRQVLDLLIAGLVSVAFVLPWLVWMFALHGVAPFRAAFDTRGALGSSSLSLPLGAALFWLVVALVMWMLHQPPLALWVLATEICVSRSAPTHTVIMYALLAALLIRAACKVLRRDEVGTTKVATACLIAVAIGAYYIPRHHFPENRLLNLIFNTRATLTSDNVAAMAWVKVHVPAGTRFLVFNQRVDPWFSDLVGEWFPYLAQHESVYTAQGKEWLPGHAFQHAVEHIPVCQHVFSADQMFATVQPDQFDAMFLAGPYDPEHTRCAAFLRAMPGMHLLYRLGDNEVFVRQ